MDISRYHVLLKQMLNEKTVDDQNSNSRVLIVDGLNTFIRAYAASPTTNSDGEHIGGISGFLLSIGHAIKAINPTRVIITLAALITTRLYGEFTGNIRLYAGK